MAIVRTIAVEGDTLLVKASGFDESLEQAQAYGMAVIDAAVRHRVTRVYCDEFDLEYRLATVDSYRLAEVVAAQAPAVVRVAIVCNPKHMANAHFWEDVAVNRGLTVRFFAAADLARGWLADNSA